ncbi:MAG: ABC transporter permease [Clostridia bacterium]|nr:ABC transporter permease [Clostridia bacterium]
MVKYILKRIAYMLLVLVILSFLMYVIYDLIPNDLARQDLEPQKQDLIKQGTYEERYAELRLKYGQDDPLVVRYLRWIGLAKTNDVYKGGNPSSGILLSEGKYDGILQGNLGYSRVKGLEAVDYIREPMANTIKLNVFTTVFTLALTIPLGIFCAVKRGSKRDTAVQMVTIVGYSIPVFITAILFIWLFAVVFPIFPVSGMKTPGSDYVGMRAFLDKLYYMALPSIVMIFTSLGGMTRYVRASMIEALSMDCIRTARAKGLREKVVIYSHAWRNALIPIMTLVIGWFLSVFSGSIMVENIFGLNGVGRVYIQSLTQSDFEVVLALQMFYVSISLVGNLIIDLAYGFADPRIRVDR